MDSKLQTNDIIELVETFGSRSMSEFQSKYFVVNSQVTSYKRLHQAILEIESRVAAKKQIERSSHKTEVQKKIVQRDYDNETDDLKKELLSIEIEQLDYDLSVYNKKYRICLEELDYFIDIVKELAQTKEELEEYKKHDPVNEKLYWILRMGKQAALDLSVMGRIGQGNMDSIAMMPIEDQEKTIAIALTYTKLLDAGVQKINEKVDENLILPDSNMFFIDDIITKKLLLTDERGK